MEKETLTTTIQTPVHGALSARDKVLLHCDQISPASFTDILAPEMIKKFVKIGEGVYGDVYKTQRDETSVVLKVIPIAGDFCVNGKPQMTFEEILSEIVISKELSDLRHGTEYGTGNFVEVKRVSLVEGRYHSVLLHQWDMYAERKGLSMTDQTCSQMHSCLLCLSLRRVVALLTLLSSTALKKLIL